MSDNGAVPPHEGARIRNPVTLESLDETLSNPEAVLRAQRDARAELLQAGTRERRFAELNEAAPIPDVPPEEDLTPAETALLVTTYPLPAPVLLVPAVSGPAPAPLVPTVPEPARNADSIGDPETAARTKTHRTKKQQLRLWKHP